MFEEQVKKTPKTNEIEGKAATVLPAFNSKRKYVYGARKFSFLKARPRAPRELQDVQIIIFDDAHNLNIACDKTQLPDKEIISVDDYIINIIEYWEKKFVIDLFSESGKYDIDNNVESFMGPLSKKLSSCLYFEKSECPYKNLRAHWTDNRFELKNFKIYKKFWIAFYSIYSMGLSSYYTKIIDGHVLHRAYGNVQDYLQGNEEELVTHPDWMKKINIFMEGLYLLDAFKIKKQINNIEIKTVREELQRMVEMKQLEFDDEIKKKERETFFLTVHNCIVEFADDYKKFQVEKIIKIGNSIYLNEFEKINLSPELIPKFEQYWELIVAYSNIVSPFMDLYLLARLFRTYKNPGRGRSAGEMAQRIIIIAGSFHTNIYRKFFSKIGIYEVADTELEQIDMQTDCLDLKREDLIPFTPIKKDLNPYTLVKELIFSKMLNFFV